MEIVKSSRFWLTLVVCIGVGVLAVLKILGGDAALAAWLGILSGFSIGKIPGSSNKPGNGSVIPPVIGLLIFLLPVLLLTACTTTEKSLIKATPVITELRQELKTYLNAECEATVDVCKKAGTLKVDDCKELKACWEKRANVYKVTMSIELAIKTGLGLVSVGNEEDAKSILEKVSAGLMGLFSELQNYKIITLK